MKKLFRKVIVILCLALAFESTAQENKNVITNMYSRGDVGKWLVEDRSWISYPTYADRGAWSKIPEPSRRAYIAQAEKFVGFDWPSVKATDYLQFTRTGDRTVVDDKTKQINHAYRTLLMAELVEGKGRFMDDLINGIYKICEMTYWGSSAHFYLYGYAGSLDQPTTVIPDKDDVIVDLFVGDMATDLAWGWYLMHDELDKVSPVIAKRLKSEIQNKVLKPYYERNDFWWLYGWRGEGDVNNWNPWINYNVLNCILLIEDDHQRKLDAVYKSLGSIDVFINNYPKDGSCSEGPGYWGSAVGKFYNYLGMIHKATNGKIDIFKNEKVKEMARYIYRVYISKGIYYTNYADAAVKINRGPSSIFRIGTKIEDPAMKSFAAFLQQRKDGNSDVGDGRISETLEALFNPVDWADTKPVEPLISEFFFPDWDAAMARDKAGSIDGFYFTAKGGNNGEQHNHNDVGSFMMYYNGDPVFLDLGVGTYTRETFGKGRWDIWTIQSNYHNVPIINGMPQKNGGKFRATNSKFTSSKDKVNFTTDISKAYIEDSKVKSWIRSYTLERGKKFTINDRYQLAEVKGENRLHFMTGLQVKILKPGTILLTGEGFKLEMRYSAESLNASVENIKIDDPKLVRNLGNEVNRIVLDIKSKGLQGAVGIEVLAVK